MPADNFARDAAILADVKAGWTYSEAAERNDVSRNVVAGICNRAGLKVGHEPHRAAVARAKMIANLPRLLAANAAWKRRNPDRVRENALKAIKARWGARP